jgi:hypothetical protein
VLTIGVSHHERMAVIRRIRRTPALAFGPAEWLPADALDDTYFRVLPSGQSTVTAEEAAMLAAVFAEDGELPARSASDFGNWGCAPRPSCNGVNNRGPTNLQTEGMPMSSDLSAQRWFVSGSALIGCATGYLLAFSRSPVVGVALPLIFGLAGSAGSIYIAKADLTSAKDRCNKAEAASGWPLSNSTCA